MHFEIESFGAFGISLFDSYIFLISVYCKHKNASCELLKDFISIDMVRQTAKNYGKWHQSTELTKCINYNPKIFVFICQYPSVIYLETNK